MTMPFDADAVRLLAVILTERDLTEIEVGEGPTRIRVRRTPAPVMAYAPPAGAPPVQPAGGTAPPVIAAVSDAKHPGAVASPMVGVAYLSAEPGSTPYVTLGQTVSIGQTLLLIEAMKTFNQIKATRAGTVSRILIQSGAPVEFGEPLMIVE